MNLLHVLFTGATLHKLTARAMIEDYVGGIMSMSASQHEVSIVAPKIIVLKYSPRIP